MNAYAEEPHIYTDQDLENHKPAEQTPQQEYQKTSVLANSRAENHFEFKGLHVGMKAEEVKKLGISRCKKPDLPIYDEECSPEPGNKTFATIGAVPILKMQVTIKKTYVTMIYIETGGAFWDELSSAMEKKYGQPTKISRKGLYYRWDKELEFLSADVLNGKTVIIYAIDPTSVKEKERAKKAPNDF